jgi:hypothetical protein
VRLVQKRGGGSDMDAGVGTLRVCSRSGGSARSEQVYGSMRLKQDWGQCEIETELGAV